MKNSEAIKPKCLVVEDDPEWRDALKLLMEKMGCDVEIAINAHTAILLLKEITFDILLLDWDLKSTSGSLFDSKTGSDILDEISKEVRRNIRVVIVTGIFNDSEFLKEFEQDLNKLHEMLDFYQPFRKILKIDYLKSLNTGLQPLQTEFERIELTKNIIKTSIHPKPPFRLDNEYPQFYDKENKPFPLPKKCHNVLRAILLEARAIHNKPYVRGFLSDHEVSILYRETENDAPGESSQFARALRKYMKKNYGWKKKNSLIKRSRNNGYAIGDDWNDKYPIFNVSEVSIDTKRKTEDAEMIIHRHSGAKKPISE